MESFEKSDKLKQDLQNAEKLLRNPNTHKQFKDYYYDKDKNVQTNSTSNVPTGVKSTNPTQSTSVKTGGN